MTTHEPAGPTVIGARLAAVMDALAAAPSALMSRRVVRRSMTDRVDQYRAAAGACASTDYGSKKAVRAHNRAADRMRQLVQDAAAEGDSAVAEMFELLDDEMAAPWISHQLLELATVPLDIEGRCLAIIERSAEDSVGDKLWLKQYRRKS